ncbi:MAG: histidine phosphatase family protein [Bacteriovoracaceae bacterium]|nr:histidine phosphatase family protein [Bacteriovoracaceae bacterium]
MKLIFIRHAHAEGHFLESPDQDMLRELTEKGTKIFKENLKIMKKALPVPDVVFCSPLIRSIQTAEIVWEHWKNADLEMLTDLHLLDDPHHLVEYISFLPNEGTYCFVGHEPHFSSVIAALLGLHPEHDFLRFKKGAFLMLEGGFWQGFMMTLFAPPAMIKEISN